MLRVRRSSMSKSKVLEAVGCPTLAWRRRRFKLLLLWRLIHGEDPPISLRVCPSLLPIVHLGAYGIHTRWHTHSANPPDVVALSYLLPSVFGTVFQLLSPLAPLLTHFSLPWISFTSLISFPLVSPKSFRFFSLSLCSCAKFKETLHISCI